MRLKGRYELVREIGRGGMGVVWCARDSLLERDVAVKLLHTSIIESDPEAVARFRREARALARLAHPNIVRLYDLVEDDGRAAIVMELVEGEPLDHHLQLGQQLSPARAAALLAPVAHALVYAHGQGIVHRDLKPGNILVEEAGGRILVSDFGLARLAEGTQSITATGVLMGSPEYWAPEQAAGQPVSAASDLYALGCIFFLLLTGHLPFEGENRLATGYRRVHEDAPDPRSFVPDLDPASATLANALLERDPQRRPKATELAARLDGQAPARLAGPSEHATLVQPRPAPTLVQAPAKPIAVRPSSKRARHRVLLAVLAVVLAALGGLAALTMRGGEQPTAAPSVQLRTQTQVVTETSEARTVTVPRTQPPPKSAPKGVPASYQGLFTSVDRLQRCHATNQFVTCTSGPSGKAAQLVVGGGVADESPAQSRDNGGPSMPMGTAFTTPAGTIRCASSSRGVTCSDVASGASFTIGDYKVIIRPADGGGGDTEATGFFASVDRLQRCFVSDDYASCTSGPSGQGVSLSPHGSAVYEGVTGSIDRGGPTLVMGRSLTNPSGTITCDSSTRGITCRDRATGNSFVIGDRYVRVINGGQETRY